MKKGKLIVILVVSILIVSGILSIKPVKKSLSMKNNDHGVALYADTKYSEAIGFFEKAIKLNHKFLEGYINLAKTYLALNNTEGAYQIAQKGLTINKNSSELNTICGQAKIKDEAYPESIVFFDLAIEADSSLAVAYYYRGIAKANMGDLEASLADYKKAQELDKNNPEYYESSLLVRTKMDDYSGIIKDYNKLLELDPNNTEAFYQRGYFKLNLNDFEGALADFDNALKLDDKLGKAHYYKGLTNAKSNHLTEAAPPFEKSAELGYKPHEAYFNAGLAYLQLNNIKLAQKAFNNCLTTNPEGIKANDAMLNLGVLELMQSNFKGAAKQFSSLLNKDTSNVEALFNRAYAYNGLKEHTKAIMDLDKCIGLGKKTSEVYYLRGVQYIGLGNYASSCSDLDIAAKAGHEEAKKLYKMYCIK